MANGALVMKPRSPAPGANEIGCRAAEHQAGQQESHDQQQLDGRPDVLKRAAVTDAAQMHQRDQPDDDEPGPGQRRVGHHRPEIDAERHGGERDRRRKSDGRRQPARHEAECRMIDAAQEIVFPARARKHQGELGIGDRPAHRHDSADGPQHQQREAGGDVLDLEPEAGEDADAHHVGNDDRCRSQPGYPGDERSA